MKPVRALSLFLIGLLIVGTLSTASPAFAVTSAEITSMSEGLSSDGGMIASAMDLAGADSDLVKEFQLGVKYGEFVARLYQGDYWGVAVDFAKFQSGRGIDKLTNLASKTLSAGAQRLLGVFTALKDTGIWLGNKALDMQFNTGVKAGYKAYKENYDQGDFVDMMHSWWIFNGKGKLEEINDNVITKEMWLAKFAEVYSVEKKAEKAPATKADIVATEKAIKKVAIVHFFTLKYPGIENNVSEELADAIVNKAGSAAIKKIAEKYKNHLDKLTAAKSKSGTVSSSGICGVVKNKDNRKDCEKTLAKIVDYRNRVLANKTFFDQHWLRNESYMPYLDNIANEKVAKFVKDQEDIIASAYEFQFGQEIRAINLSLATNKGQFDSLKNGYQNLPAEGDHWGSPFYEVSVDKGTFFVGTIKKGSIVGILHYGSFGYYDFEDGVAQKYYQKYLANEPKANVADEVRARYLEVNLARLNGLVRDFTVLQNRINSLIQSAESAWGVFSYGNVTVDGLKKLVSEIEELKKDIQSGGKFWKWRNEGWNTNSISRTIKEMDGNKKARKSSIDQMKKDYASALKVYEEEKKQRKLEERNLVDSFKKAAAEREAQALQKKKAEEKAAKEELARLEAEKQASIKKTKALEEQRTKAFNAPLKKSQEASNKVTPTTGTTKTSKTQTKSSPPAVQPSAAKKTTAPSAQPSAPKKTTAPAVQPSTQKKSTLPSGHGVIPSETVEMSGFSFIAQFKADMMTSDFFWNDVIYTVNGAIDLGSKSINDVTSVPNSGYDKQDPYQPQVGHVYAIKTRGGKYGIIRIEIVGPSQLWFTWRYQPNGSTSFP